MYQPTATSLAGFMIVAEATDRRPQLDERIE